MAEHSRKRRILCVPAGWGLRKARSLTRALCCIALPLLLLSCARAPEALYFSGPTMGTTYNITVSRSPEGVDRAELQSEIDTVLERFDELMSTWRVDSEISRLNDSPPGVWVPISPETHAVLAESLRVYRESAGRFDVTVAPLLTAWGFGPRAEGPRVPGEEELAAARAATGSDALELEDAPPRARKTVPRQIELSAIAPGYAVDLIASSFRRRGVADFMIEVGGEVRTSGSNPSSAPWRIGIEQPDAPPGTPVLAVEMHDASVSTSGDYRDFFERDGVRYSHTIDPSTGRPVAHALASVTVITPECMRADGLATALHVMGPDAGLDFAEREGVAVYMLIRRPDGSFESRQSAGFAQYERATP